MAANAPEKALDPKLVGIMKNSDLAELQSLANGDGDQSIRLAAWRRISQVTRDLNVRVQAIVEYTEAVKAAIALNSGLPPNFLSSPVGKEVLQNAMISHALKNCADQDVLAEIALSPIKDDYKKIAVGRIESAELLKKIFEGSATPEGKIMCLRRIEDSAFLRKIFEDKAQPEAIRAAAATNLKDQRSLVKAAEDSKLAESIRVAAICSCEDAKVLQKLALKDESGRIRMAAIARISDQGFLRRIIDANEFPALVEAAVRQVTDPAVLGRVAAEYKFGSGEETSKYDIASVRRAAIRKLDDQAILGRIAKEDADIQVRCEAVQRLTDQAVIREVYLKDAAASVRSYALGLLKDQDILRETALDPEKRDIAREAVKNLARQDYLAEIARSLFASPTLMMKDAAPGGLLSDVLEKIEDQALLGEFLEKSIEKARNDLNHPWLKIEAMSIVGAMRDAAALSRWAERLRGSPLESVVANRLRRVESMKGS